MTTFDIFFDLSNKYSLEYKFISEEFTIDSVPFTENKLVMSIDKAYKVICKYVDYIGEKTDEYILPTIILAKAYYNNDVINNNLLKGNRSVSQMAQGSRSVTYSTASISFDSNGLTDDVKAMLPLPKLKVI